MEFLSLINIPNLLLGSLLGLAVWVLYSASRSQRFDPVDMLLDERGKASSSRLAVFVALALSTFMLAYFTMNKGIDNETLLYMFGVYIMTWAGSKTLEKGVEVWSHRKTGGSRRSGGYGYSYDYDEEEEFRPGRPYPSKTRRASWDDSPLPEMENSPQEPLRPLPHFTPQDTPIKADLAEKD